MGNRYRNQTRVNAIMVSTLMLGKLSAHEPFNSSRTKCRCEEGPKEETEKNNNPQ